MGQYSISADIKRSPARTVRLINLKGILEHPIEAESSLEADFVYSAALFPGTVNILAQPFSLPVSPRGYTPDFLLTLESHKKIVVETKTQSKIKKYQDLFDRVAAYLVDRGMDFFVFSEANLHRKDVHKQARIICRYAKYIPEISALERVISILNEHDNGLPIKKLFEEFRVSREVIFYLITKRMVTTGNNLETSDNAIVRLVSLADYVSIDAFQDCFNATPWRMS